MTQVAIYLGDQPNLSTREKSELIGRCLVEPRPAGAVLGWVMHQRVEDVLGERAMAELQRLSMEDPRHIRAREHAHLGGVQWGWS